MDVSFWIEIPQNLVLELCQRNCFPFEERGLWIERKAIVFKMKIMEIDLRASILE